MLCTGTRCGFVRGGPVDFLAAAVGSYRAAVDLMSEKHPYLEERAGAVTAELTVARRLMEFILRLETSHTDSHVERMEMRHTAIRLGCLPGAMPTSHLYATSQETGILFDLLARLGVDPPPSLAGPVMLIPYWADYHKLSSLLVLNKQNKVFTLNVNPTRWAWFGLTQLHPDCDLVEVHPTLQATMQADQSHRSFLSGVGVVHAKVDLKQRLKGFSPKELRFVKGDAEWSSVLPLWSYLDGFSGAEFVEGGRAMKVEDVMCRLLTAISSEEDFEAFLDMCEMMDIPKHVRGKLLEQSFRTPYPHRSGRLRSTLTRRLIDRTDKEALFEGADGYELVRKEATTRLSNFTLDLHKVVGFSANEELLYQGVMTVGSSRIPVDIKHSSLDTPARLERALQPAQMLRPGGSSEEEALATVFHQSDFKRVLTLLKNYSATLPRCRGIRTVGWNFRCDEWYMPGIIVGPTGYQSNAVLVPEEGSDFVNFDTAVLPPEMTLGDIEPKVAEVISILVSGIVRSFHGLQVRPFKLLNCSGNREFCAQLFRFLGQTKPIRVNNIIPRNLATCRGYPVYVTPFNEEAVFKEGLNALMFCEKGADMTGMTVTEELSMAFAGMVADVASALLREQTSVGFEEHRSVSAANRMAIEGTSVIRRLYAKDWPSPSKRFGGVDALMANRKSRLLQEATFDVFGGKVTFNKEVWEGVVSDEDLLLDLSVLCKTARLVLNTMEVDAVSFAALFEEFYGEAPEFASQTASLS